MTNEDRYRKVLEKIECDAISSAGTFRNWAHDALNPPPQFKEVEVVRWYCPECGASYEKEHHWGLVCCQKVKIKLTGTYQRPIPQKVKRREEINIKSWDNWEFKNGTAKPLPYKTPMAFYAEWETIK